MDLTMGEKRDLIERITELVKNDILNREDRDDIYRVCLAVTQRKAFPSYRRFTAN